MASMQELLDKIDALDAKIVALPKPAPPLASQDQIDTGAAKVDKASADLDSSQQA